MKNLILFIPIILISYGCFSGIRVPPLREPVCTSTHLCVGDLNGDCIVDNAEIQKITDVIILNKGELSVDEIIMLDKSNDGTADAADLFYVLRNGGSDKCIEFLD